ncbi:hypothetical protein Syun_028287 [Stephania yunnanensis]|uniref:UspA domain-containing protein n=1 Tax=Stephania yunnanensis TaxID=152371 RepID=A0AAP0HQZ7_9MAGN
MDLATFTAPQIKQILKLASLDGDVFEALVLVKRMGTDVREGRRRQFNYIGRLLREVEPDLMDALIQAMKDGDHSKFQTISNTDWIMEDDDEELDDAKSEAEVHYVFMLHLSKPHLYGLMIKMLGKSMEVLEVDKRSLMLSSSSTVVVAVNGSRKSKYTLKWALERFSSEGKVLFKLLHVCARITTVPTPMGNYIPISQVRDDVAAAYKKEMEWKASKMLLPYKQLCSEKKEIVQIEVDDVPVAISNEVSKSQISMLVIGASSGGSFTRNYLSSVLIQELFLTWDMMIYLNVLKQLESW